MMAVKEMPLTLYRRHRTECEGGHYEPRRDVRSGQFEEGRRGWKKCACLIHASGTLGRKFNRRCTGKTDWDEAKAVAAVWEAAGTWDTAAAAIAAPNPQPDPLAAPNATPGITILEATESFIANRQNRGIEPPTLAKYQTFVKQLREYCDGRGYLRLAQLTVTDMDRFYASWKDGKRSKAKKLERLKGFIKFSVKRKWLTENIAEDLEAPEGSSIAADKMPFSDSELTRIYAACDALGGPTPFGPGHRDWSGEDVRDFIMLSVATGLRISDVATFDIGQRLKGNDVFLRMHKTKKELWTWIPDWLVARLRARESTHGPLVFRTSECKTTTMRNMADVWRVKLGKVFKLAGDFDAQPTPHRFRYTHVRMLLEHGVPIADVAELIGDTEAIVRKHYAKWVPERQARLTRILQEALGPKTPKLVAIAGGKR